MIFGESLFNDPGGNDGFARAARSDAADALVPLDVALPDIAGKFNLIIAQFHINAPSVDNLKVLNQIKPAIVKSYIKFFLRRGSKRHRYKKKP